VMTHVHNLDKQALIDILTKPKNALVKQYRKFFEFDGVELVFTDEALQAIAEQTIRRATGARGLRAIMEEVLLNVMYDLPSREDVGQCVIDEEVVSRGINPTLVPMQDEAQPRARKERSA
jgi:ATP-dependent Clp protease ATP-binding subunit ClpX